MGKIIYVYADWMAESPRLMGKLYSDVIRGTENFSFEYDDTWLESQSKGLVYDADIECFKGRQFLSDDKLIFGMFADSSPDRWGRMLLQRRESVLAREEKRKPSKLMESDYLLGVYDEARMGGLRFSLEEGGPFLSFDEKLAIPPRVDLRRLESASMHIESEDDGLQKKWLDQLLVPGSSLGGARPKATVRDEKGELWIAKFPSKNDEHDVGAWEMVVHDLAKACGLRVPDARLEYFSKNGGTYLAKRFDRDGDRRVHFASAMTMLGKQDMDKDAGYLDITEFIRSHSINATSDLMELWKRMVFNMAVSNSDDHLRNHGFILTGKGWMLSPVYDVNPIPFGDTLSLDILPGENQNDMELALESAKYYGISVKEAKEMIEDISKTVKEGWQTVAKGYKLSRSDMEYMRPAFE